MTGVILEGLDRDRTWSLEHYLQRGGYEALRKILTMPMTPEQVIDEVKKSVLRGRGGGRFSDGTQMDLHAQELCGGKVCGVQFG